MLDASGVGAGGALWLFEGGPMSVLFAATHPIAYGLGPERVVRVRPRDGWPHRRARPGSGARPRACSTTGAREEVSRSSRRAPPLPASPVASARSSGPPAGRPRWRRAGRRASGIDVHPGCSTIRVPTLVVHRAGERDGAREIAREMARASPTGRVRGSLGSTTCPGSVTPTRSSRRSRTSSPAGSCRRGAPRAQDGDGQSREPARPRARAREHVRRHEAARSEALGAGC